MGAMSITEVGIYTIEDLYAYREQRDDMTIQLIEGELVVSPSPAVLHQVVSGELFAVLRTACPPHLRVLAAPLDVRAGERSILQPDLLVVPRELRSGGQVETPPVLAVEILSPSSRRTDLVAKPQVLARFGCPHYWVVDPDEPAVRVLRLEDGAYVPEQVAEGDESLAVAEPFAVSLRPVDLTR
ncbi:hypothetical protein AVL62_15295 [Serinicoccus chungangensis]|uniref:Putative restriction endonuclease domain-containing protein n=2 Tax=Serinicoccus chungangensis TaxID=767452 RepID=A0A0W8IB59_9MICO|nr:hypothetical protein AVL62_15295 [Serinicoccus chungangensis]